jgi:hypothetical protein
VSADDEGCESCGAVPATRVEFVTFIHVLFWAQIERDNGVRCRDCALALYRRYVSMLLVLGWWGPGAILGLPLCVWRNQQALARVHRLGPVQGACATAARFAVGRDGTIADAGTRTRSGARTRRCSPLDAGRPLRKRISSYVIVYVLIALCVIVFINHNS